MPGRAPLTLAGPVPVAGQAVTDAVLTPARAEVLCRLAGKLSDRELEASQGELVTVAAALTPWSSGSGCGT